MWFSQNFMRVWIFSSFCACMHAIISYWTQTFLRSCYCCSVIKYTREQHTYHHILPTISFRRPIGKYFRDPFSQYVSLNDLSKIVIGRISSHTLGPLTTILCSYFREDFTWTPICFQMHWSWNKTKQTWIPIQFWYTKECYVSPKTWVHDLLNHRNSWDH